VSNAELSGAKWRKSTASGGDNCAEVAFVAGGVLMRHSHHPSEAVLAFSPSEWTAFLAGVRNGEFDLTKSDPAVGPI
jgi:Domain of unknown function (DUF397)